MEKVPYSVDPEWVEDPVPVEAEEEGEGLAVLEGIVSVPGAERSFRTVPVPPATKYNVPAVDRPWSGAVSLARINNRDKLRARGPAVCE